jgi:hypothetical protein
VQVVFHLIPKVCPTEAALYQLVQVIMEAQNTRAEGHIIVDRQGEGVRSLKDHPYSAAEFYHVNPRRVDIFAVQKHLSLEVGIREGFVHPIEGAQEGGLAATGGADKGGYLTFVDLNRYIYQGLGLAIEEV